MIEIERTTFTVTTTGVGRPDYSPEVTPTKPVVGSLQTRFLSSYSTYGVPLAGGTGTTIGAYYPVPTGYKLYIDNFIVNCEGSLIQYAELFKSNPLASPVVYTWFLERFRYDMRGEVNFGPQSAVEINADEGLYVVLRNNDSVGWNFSFNIQGFLERIS